MPRFPLIWLLFALGISASLTGHAESTTNRDNSTLPDLLRLMEQADGEKPVTKEQTPDLEIGDLLKLMEEAGAEMAPAPMISTQHPHGSSRVLQVPFVNIPLDKRVDAPIEGMPPTSISVDGRLDDPLWKKAAVSTGFWCSLENHPPTDQTEVRTARDENYLYFGFRLYDRKPAAIEATKNIRDTGLGYDDSITVQLDTFFNRRDISSFSMNPLGTQSDDIAGGRSSKVAWKGDWLGAATRTSNGWVAEFAIPFSILNYPPQSTVFGVNFKRYQSRSKEYSWWADITPQNRPEEMGQLRGLKLPSVATSKTKLWTFMPFVLAGKNIPDKKGDVHDYLVTGGIDIRYQPRKDLTGMISLNPDFSQVEKAFTDISFSYTEKAVDDNRPFFVEGRDYFSSADDNNEYFYSNRAADFDFGGKSFGRVGNTQFGLLATGAPNDRYDGVGRVLYELDETHSAIATVTTTRQADFNNTLALAQINGRQENGVEYAFDAAMTDTETAESSTSTEGQGGHLKGHLGWKGDYWYLKGGADKYDVNYFPALALLDSDLSGTRGTSVTTGYYREQSDRFWRLIDSYAGFEYRETDDGWLQRKKWLAGTSVEFQNQIRTAAAISQGPYRPLGTNDVRGVFANTVNQDRYYSLSVDFYTRSSVFSCGSVYDWGQLGGGDYRYGSVYAWWRPISKLYFKSSYEVTDSFGISKQAVLNGTWEITPEDSLGARYIYYESNSGTDEYYRLAYGRKAREGMDIYLVYDNDPYRAEQYSLKLVYAF